MKKKRYISDKYLLIKPVGIMPAIAYYAAFDYLQLPEWAWTIGVIGVVLSWAVYIAQRITGTASKPNMMDIDDE